jgi:hypothetical protein
VGLTIAAEATPVSGRIAWGLVASSEHLMRSLLASRIMARTTLDLDPTVLAELKRRREEEGKSLGRLASELLADALAATERSNVPEPFSWTSQPMGARVDLDDKDALFAALEGQ